MSFMTNIIKQVTTMIDQDVSIRRSLTRGFVNIRALAIFIQKRLSDTTSLDAIISAIRRYDLSNEFKEVTKKRYEILAKAKLSSRTNLCSLIVKKEKEVQEVISQCYTIFDFSKGEVFRVIEAHQSIAIVMDDTYLNKIKDRFRKSDILSVNKNLGELSLMYNSEMSLSGVFAVVNSEIALNNIDIKNAILCETEHILILNEKDLIPTLNILAHIRSWDSEKKKQSY